MNQAQGAIDAARAAGDYRQALNHALDSRERAQNAAKMAVDGRADARGQAGRVIAEVATLLSRAHAQLKDPGTRRLNRGVLLGPRATVATAERMLQEARSALKTEDYVAVTKALNGASADLQAALTHLDAPAAPARNRRQR